MSTNHILIVLGKRLNNNLLTKEGSSRVEALHRYLKRHDNLQQTAVAFCGGVTAGQNVSEAQMMHEYFRELESTLATPFELSAVILEQESTNTVENIQNVARALIESQLFQKGQSITVTFVSNDYHLQRIFDIQDLMDEQGLLRVLIEKCSLLGVELDIQREVAQHIAVAYPHQTVQGQLFLLMDELTTYRVYLEGVSVGAFERELHSVREVPASTSLQALKRVGELLDSSKGVDTSFALVTPLLPVLKACIEQTPAGTPIEKVREYLALLDTNLTFLNRYLDPEVSLEHRWWR
ncbi:YdcF family protein [Vibrio sp. T187]|uniref:YdcF family protein n=1 Tax=Vibrio TaxID=662 RepID=UPI0010C943DE|nr:MULTISPECIES: YdcF family protein [Vibrio]MBW3695631.1 YdcF family protein [Vibrio sp. T187]